MWELGRNFVSKALKSRKRRTNVPAGAGA